MLMDRYQKAVDELFAKVRATQTENIIKAGTMIAECVAKGGGVFLAGICHSIEMDLIYRGGGPIFYKKFNFRPALAVEGRKRTYTLTPAGAGAYYEELTRLRLCVADAEKGGNL